MDVKVSERYFSELYIGIITEHKDYILSKPLVYLIQ